jgi:hypothetical protein
MMSLHAALLEEYWKPVLLRLLAHQCLLYDVDVPNSAMSSDKPAESEFKGSSTSMPFGGDDEPPIVLGLTLAGLWLCRAIGGLDVLTFFAIFRENVVDVASSIRALKAAQPEVGAAVEALFAEASKRNAKATNLLVNFEVRKFMCCLRQ